MKLYIAGPMTGITELNFPAFTNAAKLLREAGFEVISPHECDVPNGSWNECMKIVLAEVLKVDGIAVLDNWKSSRGATLELYIAGQLEIPIKPLEEWLELK